MNSGDHGSPGSGLARAGGVFEDDTLIDRVNRALRSMWSRLESLPRSDVFWPASVVSEALLVAEEQRLAAARECLSNDASAVVDLMDAAQWWAVYRRTDVMYRLRDLLEAVSRDSLERLVDDQGDEVAVPLRTALLILDGPSVTA